MSESQAAIDRVRLIHSPRTWSARRSDCPHGFGSDAHDDSCFTDVTTCNGDGTDYPCSTVRAIDGE